MKVRAVYAGAESGPVTDPTGLPTPFLKSMRPDAAGAGVGMGATSTVGTYGVSPSPGPFRPMTMNPSYTPMSAGTGEATRPVVTPVA